ncbi:MAG: hypothetical protein DMG78_28200 [Acidobacteria bacterium]|nr:MAG: hypothetical protein DMG78_28200 [Acidobacteriota bacterium]
MATSRPCKTSALSRVVHNCRRVNAARGRRLMDVTLDETVKRVLADILNIDFNEINDETSTQNTESWDSANHIQLVAALEQEFSITFDVAEFESMLSFADIVAIVQSKL